MADPFVDWNGPYDDAPDESVLAEALHAHHPPDGNLDPAGERALVEPTVKPLGVEDGEQPPEPEPWGD